MDCFPKSTHFIPAKYRYSVEDYARIFINDIVCSHGIRISKISNRGAKFTSMFWRSLQKGLGTKVKLSTTFHPQMDVQAERTIKTFDDMCRDCIIDLKGNWDRNFPLVVFSFKNSYHSSKSMDPFEALYGRRCRCAIGWFEVGESSLMGPEFIY